MATELHDVFHGNAVTADHLLQRQASLGSSADYLQGLLM
jgi:hypothetical protein